MGPRTAMYAQKRIISCPYWESYPSILVSFIQAIEKILQSLNYFKSPDLLGGGGRQNSYLPHTPAQDKLLEVMRMFYGSVTPTTVPRTAED